MNFRNLAATVRPRKQLLALLTATALAVPFAAEAQAPAPAPGAPAPTAAPQAAPKAAPKAPAPAAQAPAQQAPAQGAPAQGAPAQQGAAQPADQQIQLIYAPWTKFCLKGQDANAKQVCFIGKDGRLESGQPVVAAVNIAPEGEPKKILRVTLPLGVLLVHGARIIIDSTAPAQSLS